MFTFDPSCVKVRPFVLVLALKNFSFSPFIFFSGLVHPKPGTGQMCERQMLRGHLARRVLPRVPATRGMEGAEDAGSRTFTAGDLRRSKFRPFGNGPSPEPVRVKRKKNS